MKDAFLSSCFIEDLVEAEPFDIILLVGDPNQNNQFALHFLVKTTYLTVVLFST